MDLQNSSEEAAQKIKREKLKRLAEAWAVNEQDPLPSSDILNWREPVLQAMSVGDVEQMQISAAPKAQLNVINAMDSDDEELKLKASLAILAQTGYGAIQKVETKTFNKLPDNELLPILRNQIETLKGMGVDIAALIGNVVDAEYTEVITNLEQPKNE